MLQGNEFIQLAMSSIRDKMEDHDTDLDCLGSSDRFICSLVFKAAQIEYLNILTSAS